MADIYIGNVKGPQGDTGATGPQGAAGAAATVQVGTVSTTAYGNPAQVVNSGTEHAAVLNFTIPQGAPGATVTQLDNLALNTITTSTDQYPQIQVGDLGRVIFGKIIKFFQDLVTGLAAKVNYSDALTMEEIEAASDLTDKVSAAAASKTLKESLSNMTYESNASGININVYTSQVTSIVARVSKIPELKIVHLELALNYAISIPANTSFVLLPDGYRPKENWSIPCMLTNASSSTPFMAAAFLRTDGNITQGATGQMRNFMVDVWYPTN